MADKIADNKKLKRLMTGDRPTHNTYSIAHYIGSLKSRIINQDKYDTFVFIADYHALTTHADKTSLISSNTVGMIRTMLSLGLDPKKVVLYRQSRIVETFRLHTILSMLTAMPELERQPMLKEKIASGYKLTYGLMGYPVLMASDILIMDADLVPVGKDNEAHIEITKDLARRFNSMYGHGEDVLVVPEGEIGEIVIGLDGQGKAGKSTGGIFFDDSTEEVKKKVMSMYTDPTRLKATDPGHVDGNPVFIYHDLFNTNTDEVKDLKDRYVKGTVGDVEVKQKLLSAIEQFMEPIRQKRSEIDKNMTDDDIFDLLRQGEEIANNSAEKTINRVMKAMDF
ncbi:MAG TPA: tryptophan--tRNA ligase [Candidatus Dojkabacteria bacterium]|nr:tryptophan--tRNA ligase [Candidatus Dojkabacteria bacterium]